MKKQGLLFAVLAGMLFLLPACDDRSEVKGLQSETEKVHDAAMVQIAALQRAKRQLQKEVSALEPAAATDAAIAARVDTLKTIVAQMSKANDDMMNWMSGYTPPDKMIVREALPYLRSQLSLIQQNKADIEAALAAGEKALESK